MGIFRTNDPTQYDDVDGIIIDESAPPPSIQGVATNIAILVGQFQRGPVELTGVGSIGELHEVYGKSYFSGNQALKSKKFGRLRIIRVTAAAAVKAFKTFNDGGGTPVDIIKFTAKYFGAYGNSIKVTIAAGSTSGRKYTIEDTSTYAVLPKEVYDNVVVTAIDPTTFSGSKLVDVTVLATTAEPAVAAATALATGADGTVADTDYQTAIAKAEVELSGNILFLDSYTDTRNGYLKTHAANTQDKMVIVCGDETDDKAAAITDVATYRDADGRIIYGWPWVQTSIDGTLTYTNPASWIASIISQTSPHIDPAYAANTQFLSGVTDLKYKVNRQAYIDLKEAGICALEYDPDIGFKIKSGIVTQIANSSKITILRRRMTDFLTVSIARFLKTYQNGPNTQEKRTEVKAQILDFIQRLELDKVLPTDDEVQTGKAHLVDTESLNTDSVIASGMFKILYKQRIYSAMRFIVLQAEVGESVVVTEAE